MYKVILMPLKLYAKSLNINMLSVAIFTAYLFVTTA